MVSSSRHAISGLLVVLSIVIFAQAQATPDKISGATITGKITIKGKGVPGIAVVLVQNEERHQRTRGADVEGIELTAKPLGVVSGRVALEPSKASECQGKEPPPFKDISVSAWHRKTEATKNQPQFIWSMGAPVSADERGNFSLINLAPAQYHFAARFPAKSWYLQSISLTPQAPAGTGIHHIENVFVLQVFIGSLEDHLRPS